MNIIFLKIDIEFFITNLKYRLKYRWKRPQKLNVLYFVFRPEQHHPGLADRLKAVISLYNHAKANGYQFKFYFETPFVLKDYLKPKLDWPLGLDELEYSVRDTKIINETNWHKLPILIPNKQYHCYNYAGNDIPWKFSDTGWLWTDLFHELFEPSEHLQKAFNALDLSSPYVSIHLRFVNALERFENTFFDNYIEEPERRAKLIDRCKSCIKEICEENVGRSVYVFSDSKLFLDSLSDMPVKVLGSSNIGHIGTKSGVAVQLKTFLDLYVMSKSTAIYRLRGKEIYNLSCFALLAARIGNVPFIDREIAEEQ